MTSRISLSALAALLMMISVVPFAPASADHGDGHLDRTITVSGAGESFAPPDTASVSTGVVTEASDAKTAVRLNSSSVKSLFAALTRIGIGEADMQTSAFNVTPVYGRPQAGALPKIDGYRATNTVSVRVRDLSMLGRLLDSLIEAGANQMNSVHFYISDSEKHLDAARQRAVTDARRKAEIYASAAGAQLGRVIAISEGTVSAPSPVLLRSVMRAATQESVPVASGEQSVRVRITATYEIK